MKFASRGAAVPETVVTLGVVLTLLFGTFELGAIGLAQLAGDGAAYVAAHASVLGNDPQAAIASPFPIVAQNGTLQVDRNAPDASNEVVDFQVTDPLNRHGGAQIVRPAHTQATITNDGFGPGGILPKIDLSSAVIEPNMMVSGQGYNLNGAGLNSSTTYSNQISYFADDGNAPPYFIGFRFLYHCSPADGSGCGSNASLWSAGFAEQLDGRNWTKAGNGVAPGAVYESMSLHQRIYAQIAQKLAAQPIAIGHATGSVLDPKTSPCMETVNGWDAQITVGVPLGSTDTSNNPLTPTNEVPGCS